MLGRTHAFRVRAENGRIVPESGYVLPPEGFRFKAALTDALPLDAGISDFAGEAELRANDSLVWFEGQVPPCEDGIFYLAYGPGK